MPYFVSFYVDIQNNKPICMNKFTIDIDETFKYHYRSLCLYVLHYVHDTDIAEDIVQDSFSALWEKLSISGAKIERKFTHFYLTNIHKFCIVNLPAIPVINMKTKTKEYENPG